MADIDPCELPISIHYKDKNITSIKSSLYYVRQVMENIKDAGDLRKFIHNFGKERGLEVGKKLLTELDTLGKYGMNVARILNPKWAGDHLQAALSLMEQSSSVVKGAGLNVEGLTQLKQKAYWGSVNRDIEAIGFAKEFRSGGFDILIREVIFSGKKFEGPMATEINQTAAILKRHYAIMNRELNAAGLRVASVSNYSGPMMHDGSAIFGNKTKWFQALDRALDFNKEFPEVSSEAIAEFRNLIRSGAELPVKATNKLHQILDFSFKHITEKESMLHDFMPDSLQAPMSIADRRSRARTFTTWKSGEATQLYLNEFGKNKTLASQMQVYSRMAAKDAGLVTYFGASPKKGFEMVKTFTTSQMKLAGKTDAEIKSASKQLDIAWDALSKPKATIPTGIGGFLMNLRTAAAQAKLGTSGVTSLIMDPAATAVQHRNLMQQGYVSSIYNTVRFYIPSLLEAATAGKSALEDSYLYSNLDLITSYEELSHMNGGWLGNRLRQSGEYVAKGSGAYFFNKVAHITNAKMYLTFLADAANGGKISNIMRADLQKFGISQNEINITAKLGLSSESGMRNIFRMTEVEFMTLNPDITDPLVATAKLASYKEKMGQWLLHKIKGGAPIPGNRERRILLGDTTAGSLEGEARRFLMQFKATQTKVFLDNTIGAARRLDPNGNQGGAANWTNRENLYHMGVLAGTFTAAGATNIILNALVTGDEKTLKRFQDGELSLLPESFARGGVAGIPGDLFSMKSTTSEMVSQIIGSPALNAAVQPFVSLTTATKGENPAKAALDMAKTFVPGANMFYLKPFVQGLTEAARSSKHYSGKDTGNDL